jgi:hypothetical protein
MDSTGVGYTTAKAHKPLGFDISVSFNAVSFLHLRTIFKPADLNLDIAQLRPPSGEAPTIAGPETTTIYDLDIDGDGSYDDGTPEGPQGLDFRRHLK